MLKWLKDWFQGFLRDAFHTGGVLELNNEVPGRFYGHTGTIHRTGHLDIEVSETGFVVAVWYRCQPLPFKQTNVGIDRGIEMVSMYDNHPMPAIVGVVLDDKSGD